MRRELVRRGDGGGFGGPLPDPGTSAPEGVRSTNPVVVGDVVDCEPGEGADEGVIVEIRPRRNYVIRRASNLSKESHHHRLEHRPGAADGDAAFAGDASRSSWTVFW